MSVFVAVCLSVYVLVSLRERISGTKRPNFTDFLMRVTCTRFNRVLDVFIKRIFHVNGFKLFSFPRLLTPLT